MLVLPRLTIVDLYTVNWLRVGLRISDRHGDPLDSVTCLDSVSVPPVLLCVLNVIEEDKCIDSSHEFEYTLPRDVVWLQYCDRFHLNPPFSVQVGREQDRFASHHPTSRFCGEFPREQEVGSSCALDCNEQASAVCASWRLDYIAT